MAQVKEPIEQPTTTKMDGQDQPGSDFPPLRDDIPSPKETEEFRNRAFDHYHDVLSKLADS